MRPLHFNVELTGNLDQETWPVYLSPQSRLNAMTSMLAETASIHRLVTKSLISVTITTNPVVQLLIGDRQRSRRIAIVLTDPTGVVYLLKDNLSSGFDYEATATVAFTLGEFIENFPNALELDQHRNSRLSPDQQRLDV